MKSYLFATAAVIALNTAAYAADPAPAQVTKPAASVAAAKSNTDFIPPEQWKKMSKEERKKVMDARRAKREAEHAEWKKKYDAASVEEKAKMRDELQSKHELNKAAWKERYNQASPEEKKKMEENIKKREEWKKAHPKGAQPATPATPATPAKP